MKEYKRNSAGTFKLNKIEPIHRWYAYLEGYSSCLIEDIISEIGASNISAIYDPFCGTGTTCLVASSYGIKSYYSETNPFMRKVIEAKINCVKRLKDNQINSKNLINLFLEIENLEITKSTEYLFWNGFEKYFDQEVLNEIIIINKTISNMDDNDSKEIAEVLLASVLVKASKMIRQGDLRFAKKNEKKEGDHDVKKLFLDKLSDAIADIDDDKIKVLEETNLLNDDARNINSENLVDCIITSPPYLNGTNYIRNTKLELKLTKFIESEKDLPEFHSKGIIAGINNVSKRKNDIVCDECVKPYLEKITPVSYDSRIPKMISGYFHDMEDVIIKLSTILKDGGYFIMDIGDSQFSGIHIPTHELLVKICAKHGFKLYGDEILRKRHSKNGMVLTQRLLKFKLSKDSTINEKNSSDKSYKRSATDFISNFPYKKEPYSSRNWGHEWHSLCSYHGKLKPSIAYFLVKNFTEKNDVVLDPLCGVGTIPFEACLQGRVGIGNDLSEMAYVVTKAKLNKVCCEDALGMLEVLEKYINENINTHDTENEIIKYKNFGFNGKVSDYFELNTYKEILCARRYFISHIATLTNEEALVYACFLHILHGNRPYALSRNSHPLTPYAPNGDFVYKNVVEHIRKKIILSYKNATFENYIDGLAIYGDYSKLPEKGIKADAIITSPPFVDSMRFYMQNWMRLWLCGWEPNDFKEADTKFIDQKQKKNFDLYLNFFETCAKLLKKEGKLILHLGKTKNIDMAEELSKRASKCFTEVCRGCENVLDIEKHGIADKGATIEHEFLFLIKKD